MDDADQPTWHWLWHVYATGMTGVAVAAVFVLDDHVGERSPWGATTALVAMALWLTLAGRHVPRLGPLGWRSVGYVTVAVALWIAALWCSIAAFAAMPALYPIVFSTIPLAPAIATSLVLSLIPLGFDVSKSGVDSSHFRLAVAMTLIGVLTAPIIGIVIISAVRQRIRLANLVRELSESRAEAARLSREAGIAAERDRLAHEIHDTLAQGFTSIVALAQAVEAERDTNTAAAARHITLIQQTARENLAEARTMVTRLTPTALDGATLPAAIRRQCQAFSAETGIAVELAVDDGTPSRGMATDVTLLRVAQEALTNVRRHAGASTVRVGLRADRGTLRLSLSDNGIGLAEQHVDGFGLRGIRTRVEQVGGHVLVTSEPGAGTTVCVEVPA